MQLYQLPDKITNHFFSKLVELAYNSMIYFLIGKLLFEIGYEVISRLKIFNFNEIFKYII